MFSAGLFQTTQAFCESVQLRLSSASLISKFQMILARIILISVYARLIRCMFISKSSNNLLLSGKWRAYVLLHSNAVPRPKAKRLSGFPLVVGKARVTKPALRDERFGKHEVLAAVVRGPLVNSDDGLCEYIDQISDTPSRIKTSRSSREQGTYALWYKISAESVSPFMHHAR